MTVFLYASPGFGVTQDIVEDEIEAFLGEKGEVTGGGTGVGGSNIDVEVFGELI